MREEAAAYTVSCGRCRVDCTWDPKNSNIAVLSCAILWLVALEVQESQTILYEVAERYDLPTKAPTTTLIAAIWSFICKSLYS